MATRICRGFSLDGYPLDLTYDDKDVMFRGRLIFNGEPACIVQVIKNPEYSNRYHVILVSHLSKEVLAIQKNLSYSGLLNAMDDYRCW